VLNGGAGNDRLTAGDTEADLRDLVYGGDGHDEIDGGFGNDELRGDGGHDTITGGAGVDTIIGGIGDDVLTGQIWSDVILGGDGMDFINGGFGHDRVNGGADADRFYHLGVEGHGSDWVQDFSDTGGDVLVFGGTGSISDFQVNVTETEAAGQAGVAEAFVIHNRPSRSSGRWSTERRRRRTPSCWAARNTTCCDSARATPRHPIFGKLRLATSLCRGVA
jgi:Ca2+-binding RTX toxin-like protein